MKMRNRWNRFIYRLWAPVYDALLERLFSNGRKRAMKVAEIQPGERVCFVGIGTGTDLLPFDDESFDVAVLNLILRGMYRIVLLRNHAENLEEL